MPAVEFCEKNATGILVVIVLILVFWVVYRKESMCGGCDQQCKCCGYETFARGSNERFSKTTNEGMVIGDKHLTSVGDSYPERMTIGDKQLASVGDYYPERMMGGGGHIATLGDSYPERMQGRPIIYDDLLSKVGHGVI